MNAPLALLRAAWRIRLAWARLRRRTTTMDMVRMIGFYEQMWRSAARNQAAEMTEIAPALWRIRGARSSTLVHNYVLQIDDPVTLQIAGDKALCHRLLAEAGVPVPEHAVFTLETLDVATRFIERFPMACFVVKPAAGTSGARGVTTHITTGRDCRKAAALASLYSETILIERWIPGESYRLLFLDGELIHTSRRKGCWVLGDGVSTLGTLVNSCRSEGTSAQSRRDLAATLAAQRLGLDSVPEKGRRVLVRSVSADKTASAEVRTVFDEHATADTGPELVRQCALAVDIIGARFAGVDIITCDPGASLDRSGGVVIEINTTPGLHHHYNLSGGSPGPDPATVVLGRVLDRRIEMSPLRQTFLAHSD